MKRAASSPGVIADQQNSKSEEFADAVQQWRAEATAAGAGRPTNPVRLTLAPQLGDKIDGAWWPRTGVLARELPGLVAVLDVRLGQVTDIDVNWSSLQSAPDLNWHWFQGVHPHVMTVGGRDARARILVVPHRTHTALAYMLLRRAAGLPVDAAHRDSRAFETAECIVRVARGDQMFGIGRSRRVDTAATPIP